MRIEQDFLKAGYFWLPENEKRKLPGTLKISDGGEILFGSVLTLIFVPCTYYLLFRQRV